MEGQISELIEQLQSKDRGLRFSAARQLVDARVKQAIPILKTWIGASDRYGHAAALGAIIQIDSTQLDSLLPLLIEALESDGLEQVEAISSLGELSHEALPAVPALERLLDEEPPTCWLSSDALFQITGDDSSVIEVGNRLLKDPDELIRVLAVEHLEQLGESVVPTLEKVAVEDSSDLVRNRAAAALADIETNNWLPPYKE